MQGLLVRCFLIGRRKKNTTSLIILLFIITFHCCTIRGSNQLAFSSSVAKCLLLQWINTITIQSWYQKYIWWWGSLPISKGKAWENIPLFLIKFQKKASWWFRLQSQLDFLTLKVALNQVSHYFVFLLRLLGWLLHITKHSCHQA